MKSENIREKYEKEIYRLIYDTESNDTCEREKAIDDTIIEYVKENNIKKLYRYRSVNEYSKKDIIGKSIWLSTANEFNDMYDSAVCFIDDINKENIRKTMTTVIRGTDYSKNSFLRKYMKKKILNIVNNGLRENSKPVELFFRIHTKRICENIRKETLIGCFCEKFDSAYMWGVYGDHGKGICIEYDYQEIAELAKHNKMKLCPVLYRNEYANAESLFIEYKKTGETFNTNYLATIKSMEWKQENEWRIIGKTDKNKGENIRLIKPTCIYLGPYIDKKSRKEIVRIAQENKIKCKSLEKEMSKFSFVIRKN